MGMCENYNIFDEEDEREYQELKKEVENIKKQEEKFRRAIAARKTLKWMMDI